MTRLTDGERVLLVEDDAVYADVLAKALQRRGFEVTTAHSCGEARAHIARGLPDLAVLDLRVGGESGLSLVPLLTRGVARALGIHRRTLQRKLQKRPVGE